MRNRIASLPKRKSPRLKGFDYSAPYVYSVTVCTRDRAPVFVNDRLNQKLIDCLLVTMDKDGAQLIAYCLMPDHLHLLLTLESGPDLTLSRLIGGFKSKSTTIFWESGGHGPLWQARFYDHVLRKDEAVEQVANYVVNNPVRRGIVSYWRDYPYCSLVNP